MWWTLTKEAHLEMVMETPCAVGGRVAAAVLQPPPSPTTLKIQNGRNSPTKDVRYNVNINNNNNKRADNSSAFSTGSFFRMSGRRNNGKRMATKRPPSDGGGAGFASPPTPPPTPTASVVGKDQEDRGAVVGTSPSSTSDAVVARLLVLASACQRGVKFLQQNSSAVLLFPLNIA
jgi:hypothetical protein